MSKMLPPRGSITGVGHAQDAHCPLSELKECQKLFAKWRSEVDRARCVTRWLVIAFRGTMLIRILTGVIPVLSRLTLKRSSLE